MGPISRGRHITLSFCIFLIASLRICELCVCVRSNGESARASEYPIQRGYIHSIQKNRGKKYKKNEEKSNSSHNNALNIFPISFFFFLSCVCVMLAVQHFILFVFVIVVCSGNGNTLTPLRCKVWTRKKEENVNETFLEKIQQEKESEKNVFQSEMDKTLCNMYKKIHLALTQCPRARFSYVCSYADIYTCISYVRGVATSFWTL